MFSRRAFRTRRTYRAAAVAAAIGLGGVIVVAPGEGKDRLTLELDGSVVYIQAHDGPIDCQRPATFNASVSGVRSRATRKQLAQLALDYRPQPGATLSINGLRYSLVYVSKDVDFDERQITWTFKPVPVDEAVAERAEEAVLRYQTKRRGKQHVEAFVSRATCV